MSSTTIPKNLPKEPALNYRALLDEGLNHIRGMAETTWTDHNSHDPGINILEQVCFALTDLGYRVDHGIKDLLAQQDGSNPYTSLYSPAKILTTNPVTFNDLRKLILNVKGIRNAWIEATGAPSTELYLDKDEKTLTFKVPEGDSPTAFKGFYKVLLESDSSEVNSNMVADVRSLLQAHRGFCERCTGITTLSELKISVKADIEIDASLNATDILIDVYYAINTVISPRIPRYTLAEMKEKGYSTETIFQGPLLSRGFIEDADLEKFKKKTEIRVSDIINAVMDVEGVLAVKDIRLESGSTKASWVMPLSENQSPVLDSINTRIDLYSENVLADVSWKKVSASYKKWLTKDLPVEMDTSDLDIMPEWGTYREVDNYTSIQRDFSENYGIGTLGLPITADAKRQAYARQLKGYLAFFEQILANGHAQAANIKDLYSFTNTDIKTYYSQVVSDIPEVEDILKKQCTLTDAFIVGKTPGQEGFILRNRAIQFADDNSIVDADIVDFTILPATMADLLTMIAYDPDTRTLTIDTGNCSYGDSFHIRYNTYFEDIADFQLKLDDITEDEDTALDRKNRFLNHLMARFGEQFTEYTLPQHEINNKITLQRLIADKLTFLQNYPKISGGRGQGFDYSQESWENTDNISGLKQRIAHLLGIDAYHDESIIDNQKEAFYIVEHILLYPPVNDTDYNGPYLSLRHEITSFADNSGQVTCTCPTHNLYEGEKIEITGSTHYTGIYKVSNVTKTTFDIEAEFVDSETGYWIRVNEHKDPYSLQVSFVFPNWIGRFANTNFMTLVEKTIYREVPAHTRPNIYWLPESVPGTDWEIVDIQSYMDDYGISYEAFAGDEEDEAQVSAYIATLLAAIPPQNSMEEFEGVYKDWLEKLKAYVNANVNKKTDNAYDLLASCNTMVSLLGLGVVVPFAQSLDHDLHLLAQGSKKNVVLVPESIPSGDQITISFWAYGDSTLPVQTHIIQTQDANDKTVIRIHLPWNSGDIVFDCGTTGSYDRISYQGEAANYKDTWTHWAFTKDASTGEMKIYVNGFLKHEETGKIKALPASTIAKLGSACNNTQYYRGHLADFQIWSVARTPDEIRRDMNRRLTGEEEGLSLYLKLDESLGSILKDATPNLRHSTYSGFLASSYLNFDGATNYITADAVCATDFSAGLALECWVKFDANAADNDTIIAVNAADNNSLLVLDYDCSTNKLQVYNHVDGGDNDTALTSTNTFALDTWFHVALVLDTKNTAIQLYVNGTLEEELSPVAISLPAPDSKFSIGQQWNGENNSNFLQGQLSDVRVWSRVLNNTEVYSGFTKRMQGNEIGLAACWRLDDGSGNTAVDSAGNALDGTIEGTASWS